MPLVSRAGDQLAAGRLVPGRRPIGVVGRDLLGDSGLGATGKGWVGDSDSPGAPPCGTGRSSTGITGAPVSRARVKIRPCLVRLDHRRRARGRHRSPSPGSAGPARRSPRRRGGWSGSSRPARRSRLAGRPPSWRRRPSPGARGAVEVGAGAGGRQEHQAARLVRRHRRPDVGRAGDEAGTGLASGSKVHFGAPVRTS